MKRKLLLLSVVILAVVFGISVAVIMHNGARINLKKLGYSVSSAINVSPGITEADMYKKGISRNLLSGKVITLFVPPAGKRAKDFYNAVFNALKQGKFVDLSGSSYTLKRPYPNVFYIYNTSHNSNKMDYIIIFTAVDEKTLKETVYLFTVSPVFMQEAVNKTTKHLVEIASRRRF